MKSINVLIVDIDKKNLRDLRSYLLPKSNRYKVAFANNITKAEYVLKKFTVNLVISNVKLSGENGVELLLRIKRRYIEIHVVLYGENITENLRRIAYHNGAAAVLACPFSEEELLSCFDTIFEKEENEAWHNNVSLSDVIQLQEIGKNSGKIVVTAKNGKSGIINISAGSFVSAEIEEKLGVEAVAEMLSLHSPSIQIFPDNNLINQVKGQSLTGVIIQATAMLDEKKTQ